MERNWRLRLLTLVTYLVTSAFGFVCGAAWHEAKWRNRYPPIRIELVPIHPEELQPGPPAWRPKDSRA